MKNSFDGLLKLFTISAMAKLGIKFEYVEDKIPTWYAETVDFITKAVTAKKLRIKKRTARRLIELPQLLADCAGGSETGAYEDAKESIFELFDWVEWNRKEGNWARIPALGQDQTLFLSYLRKAVLKDSESSVTWLKQKIGQLGEPLLVKCFAGDLSEEFDKPAGFPAVLRKKTDKQIWDKICEISSYFGTEDDKVPGLALQGACKLKDPVKFEIWKYGRDYLQKKAKETLTKLVRNYGVVDKASVPLMPIKELRIALKQSGIIWPMLNPRLKRGELVADTGYIYTKNGLALGRTIPPEALVDYNNGFSEDFVNKFVSKRNTMAYMKIKPGFAQGFIPVYPEGRLNANKEVVFDGISEFVEKLDTHRAKWLLDISSKDDLTKMKATVLELVYQNSMRIGSKLGSTMVDGVATDTFGLTFFQRKHVKILGNGTVVKIEYPGKAAQIQTQVVKAKNNPKYQIAINNFISYIRDKKPNDYIFTFTENGREKKFTAAMANAYLKTIVTIKGFTIHKFRHAKANYLAKPILAACPLLGKDNTFAEVRDWFNESMKPVGEALGHFKSGETTGTTAIKSYIDPKMSKKFFEDCNVQITKEIEAQLKKA